MIVLDYSDHRPIYDQIRTKLQDLILRGILAEDAPLPSVRSLAVDLAINPNTIQRAYAELEREGWIYSVRGKGSFVAHGAGAKTGRRKELRKELTALVEAARLVGVTEAEFLEAVNEEWRENDNRGESV